MGCDLGQGYYFAPPLSEADLDAYLAEGGGRVIEPPTIPRTSDATHGDGDQASGAPAPPDPLEARTEGGAGG